MEQKKELRQRFQALTKTTHNSRVEILKVLVFEGLIRSPVFRKTGPHKIETMKQLRNSGFCLLLVGKLTYWVVAHSDNWLIATTRKATKSNQKQAKGGLKSAVLVLQQPYHNDLNLLALHISQGGLEQECTLEQSRNLAKR